MQSKSEMKIVLCSVPIKTERDYQKSELPEIPKIAIVSLLKWMEKYGYSGDFLDIDMLLPSEKEMFDYFKDKQPDVVGLSAVVSTSYLQVKNISKIIRKACPSSTIVIGSNMAVSANLLLRKTEIDFCVLGNGEIALVELLDYIREHGNEKVMDKLLKIKGLAFINKENELEFTGYGDPIPNEENPCIDYNILKKGLFLKPELINNYFCEAKNSANWFADKIRQDKKSNIAALWVCKGCVARCTFCQRFSRGYHTFDLKKIENHVKELKEEHDVRFIVITGENFGLPREFAYEVARILNKYDMQWISFASRCTNFKPEDYKFFKEHGCVGIQFGVESGSQKILDIMEKRFTVEQIYEALKCAIENNLLSPISLCIGMPGETDDTIIETGKFVGKIFSLRGRAPDRFAIYYVLPLPGSALYEYGQLKGIIGSSLEEEEEYLKDVSDRSIDNRFYVNLSGISNRKALFWPHLIWYEATRTFHNEQKKKVSKEDSSVKQLFRVLSKQFSAYEFIKRGLKSPIMILNGFLCRSYFATRIPRTILYPVMRNLLYLEYLVKLPLSKVELKLKKCKDKIVTSESLRRINKRLREELPEPKTLTEKNQILLYQGR